METTEQTLVESFRFLEQHLKATLKRVIRVRIDEDTSKKGERDYRLVSYRLSFPDRQLIIQAEDPKQAGLVYMLRYENIFDLAFHETELMLKTWVYCEDNGGNRFYLRNKPYPGLKQLFHE